MLMSNWQKHNSFSISLITSTEKNPKRSISKPMYRNFKQEDSSCFSPHLSTLKTKRQWGISVYLEKQHEEVNKPLPVWSCLHLSNVVITEIKALITGLQEKINPLLLELRKKGRQTPRHPSDLCLRELRFKNLHCQGGSRAGVTSTSVQKWSLPNTVSWAEAVVLPGRRIPWAVPGELSRGTEMTPWYLQQATLPSHSSSPHLMLFQSFLLTDE